MLYANGIITKILDDANKGNEVSWRFANKYVWKRKWSILGLNILVWLMTFAFVVVNSLINNAISFINCWNWINNINSFNNCNNCYFDTINIFIYFNANSKGFNYY